MFLDVSLVKLVNFWLYILFQIFGLKILISNIYIFLGKYIDNQVLLLCWYLSWRLCQYPKHYLLSNGGVKFLSEFPLYFENIKVVRRNTEIYSLFCIYLIRALVYGSRFHLYCTGSQFKTKWENILKIFQNINQNAHETL